jgi:hypothetical protein
MAGNKSKYNYLVVKNSYVMVSSGGQQVCAGYRNYSTQQATADLSRRAIVHFLSP